MKKSIYIGRVQLEFSEGVRFHVTNIQCHKWNIQESLCIPPFIAGSAVFGVGTPGISPTLCPLQLCIQLTRTQAGAWWLLWIPPTIVSFQALLSWPSCRFFSPSRGNFDSLLPGLPGPRKPTRCTINFCVIFSKKPSLNAQVELHGLQNTISLTPVFNLYSVWECFVPKSVSPK